MKRLPIGISDFKKLIEGGYYYVDKTLLLQELLEQGAETVLLPRPRRFGKTLNLSMLYYFFCNNEKDSRLFENTAIAQHADHMAHQGQYPVIFLTFKDVKETTWEGAYKKIAEIIAQLFEQHKHIINDTFSERESIIYNDILHATSSLLHLGSSLKFLSDLLHRHYNKKVIILLDEYDAPIQTAFIQGYYQEMIALIRDLLSSALKDNNKLERGVLTGILRTSKEGIFSGLNNLKICTVLEKQFSDKFGFTQSEVDVFLSDYGLEGQSQAIKEWYNGYMFGQSTMYNPWSLLSCIDFKGTLQPYWVNTSDNKLIKKTIIDAPLHVQEQLESLLLNKKITQQIKDDFPLPEITNNELAVWSLLFFTGYLTAKKTELVMGRFMCDLIIPNLEVRTVYEELLQETLTKSLKKTSLRELEKALEAGDGEIFEDILQEYLINSISMFDLPNDEPEKSYHLFVLGLLVTLHNLYEVRSNRESGYGRYDIMLFPKDTTKRGIIIEFKRTRAHENLSEMAQDALDQINKREYATELRSCGVTKITAFGIAFRGKEMVLKATAL